MTTKFTEEQYEEIRNFRDFLRAAHDEIGGVDDIPVVEFDVDGQGELAGTTFHSKSYLFRSEITAIRK